MNKTETVSVILPVYNGEAFVREALNSLKEQTYENLQVIIIDDGSIDMTSSICKDWCQDGLNYEYHYQENMGISAAINRGISLATGQYIARMDADDIALPSRISEQVSFLESNKHIDIVSTGYKPFSVDAVSLPTVMHPSDPTLISLLLCYCSPVCHPSVLARRRVFDNHKYSLHSAAEDHELWCRLAIHHKISNIEKELLLYRQHTNSLSRRKKRNIRFETLKNGSIYFLRNHKNFANLSFSRCQNQLAKSETIRLWPALVILTVAKIISYFRMKSK
jgi:glycosyltransferase involved in cell wall biosynthesis